MFTTRSCGNAAGNAVVACNGPTTDPPVSCPRCTNAAEFQELLGPVNAVCCDNPREDCSSGVPTTCYDACADVLIGFRNTCTTYLANRENAQVKAIIDAAVCCNHNRWSEVPREECIANVPDSSAARQVACRSFI